LKRDLTRITALDLAFVVLLLAVPGRVLVRSWQAGGGQPAAYVYRNNHLLGVYQLDRDQVIAIGDRARPDMRIEIRGGAVRVAESDCPRGVCRQAGWVRTPGRSIVCIPNKVLVELRGERKGYDAESY
jgi:hypothetical protein